MMALTKPIIVAPGGWEDTLPDRLKADIKMDRLIQIMAVSKGKEQPGLATWAEVCAYCMTASLVAPPSRELVSTYQYALKQYLSTHGREIPDFIGDEREPTEYELKEIEKFRRWLWDRAQKAYRERTKGEAKKQNEQALNRGLLKYTYKEKKDS